MSVSQLCFDMFSWVGKKGAELQLEYQEFGIFQSLPMVMYQVWNDHPWHMSWWKQNEVCSSSLFLALRLGYGHNLVTSEHYLFYFKRFSK